MAREALVGLVPDDWEQTTLGEACARGGGDIQTGALRQLTSRIGLRPRRNSIDHAAEYWR